MKIKLIREIFNSSSTIGKLYLDDVFECFTLEDAVRDSKIEGKTAIPYGKYRVTIDFSNRFKKLMPHLLDVPGFTGIRIHAGNTENDTEGCILLGKTTDLLTISHSRDAVNDFMGKLDSALKKDSVWMEVTK
jgi:hypothetical protein